jgi:hypothetical protein
MSVVLRHNIGVTTSADPVHFKARAWETLRFSNATSRTVSDFDPARADGAGNDYTPARGNSLARSGVFVWGRPSFGGIGSEGRDAQLYLLWAPMPQPDGALRFEFQPQYFTGLDGAGRPQFSARGRDARPLDLDAETPGDQPEEARDFVGQMGISWLPSLEQFVMIYGGEGVAMFSDPILGSDIEKVRHDPRGSLFVRFAARPGWHPRPQQLPRRGLCPLRPRLLARPGQQRQRRALRSQHRRRMDDRRLGWQHQPLLVSVHVEPVSGRVDEDDALAPLTKCSCWRQQRQRNKPVH